MSADDLMTSNELSDLIRRPVGWLAKLRMSGEGPPYLKIDRKFTTDAGTWMFGSTAACAPARRSRSHVARSSRIAKRATTPSRSPRRARDDASRSPRRARASRNPHRTRVHPAPPPDTGRKFMKEKRNARPGAHPGAGAASTSASGCRVDSTASLASARVSASPVPLCTKERMAELEAILDRRIEQIRRRGVRR
jgi:hypothetical protein